MSNFLQFLTGNKKTLLLIIILFSFLLVFSGRFALDDACDLWNSKTADYFFRLRYSLKGQEKASRYLYSYPIDRQDLDTLNITPDNRLVFAEMINMLAVSGVTVVDILFQQQLESAGTGDDELIFFTREAGNVVFPIEEITPAPETTDPFTEKIGRKSLWFPAVRQQGVPLRFSGINYPFAELVVHARGLGIWNTLPDTDGVIRRQPLLYLFREGYLPSLALTAVCRYFQIDYRKVEVFFGSHIRLRDAHAPAGNKRDYIIPIDRQGCLLINYTGPWRNNSVVNFPARQFFKRWQDPETRDQLTPLITGKIAVVSDISTHFSRGIFDEVFPHSGVLVNTINTILTENYIYEPGLADEILTAVVLAILLWLLACRFRPGLFILFTVILLLLFISGNGLGFLFYGRLPRVNTQILAVLLAAAAVIVGKYIIVNAEKTAFERKYNAANSYFLKLARDSRGALIALDSWLAKQAGETYQPGQLDLVRSSIQKLKAELPDSRQAEEGPIPAKTAGSTGWINQQAWGGVLEHKNDINPLDTLLGGLFHEILNPLGGIHAPLENIEHKLRQLQVFEDGRFGQFFQRIFRNIKRIEELVKRFKILSGNKEKDIRQIDIDELIKKAAGRFRERIDSRIRIVCRIDRRAVINANPDSLFLILTNIIENAIDAVRGRGKIEIDARERDGCPVISVKDNGTGIKQEALGKIFTPFYTGKAAGEGAGLGLYFARVLVMRMGWQIGVYSREGRGSEFLLIGGIKPGGPG